jgi:A/G-specific adenine glycosylase
MQQTGKSRAAILFEFVSGIHNRRLAGAQLDDVLRHGGTCYYTRARTLMPRQMLLYMTMAEIFPALVRIVPQRHWSVYSGGYCPAFKEPVALVDGNVYRVLARVFGIDVSIDSNEGRKVFSQQANRILDRRHPDIHNQAVMELGALVCVPRNPHCQDCPLSAVCVAFNTGRVDELPVRTAKNRPKERYFNYFFMINDAGFYMKKRIDKDIWNSLYEFPLIETANPVTFLELASSKEWCEIFGSYSVPRNIIPKTFRHQLTHQTIFCNFYFLRVPDGYPPKDKNFVCVAAGNLKMYAVPRLIDKYLASLKQEGLI